MDYLRFGNNNFNYQLQRLRYQEEPIPIRCSAKLRITKGYLFLRKAS